MIRSFFKAAVLLALSSTPCFAKDAIVNGGSSSSIEIKDGGGVATIRGSAGIANILGDKVELNNRVVYLNGQSFGTTPQVCEVKYIITSSARTLLIDGKPRSQPALR